MAEPRLRLGECYAGKHILLTGASGFVGKVWLAMVLDRLPRVGRIYVHIRPRALVPARSRLEKILNTSPALKPLHERFGPGLSDYLAARVEVLEGELCDPALGLDDATAARLRRKLDLVVHCAGLVDFNPDLRKALASNVDATLNVADFVESCDRAKLLHISTCYVAGARHGHVPERHAANYAPKGEGFCVERELAEARVAADRICAEHESEEHKRRVRQEVIDLVRERRSGERPKLVANLTRRRLREELKQALSDEGMRRAERWGWPNTYTYSKSLAESLLHKRRDRLDFSILRPTIVESAQSFPFPGWNESFNGSAPLAYVMGSWFRMVPARPDAPFDVIPVDEVCRAMTIVGGALMQGRAAPVYQIGTSDIHRLSVGRAAELIVLAHRRYHRSRLRPRNEQVLKSRWDAILVEPDTLFGVDANRNAVKLALEALDLLPDRMRAKARKLIARTESADDKLAKIQQMVRLYLPFMYECFYVFECRAIDRVQPVEPELRFDPRAIDWRSYWLEVHVPGLRRWAFPLIEGKRPERYRALHAVELRAPTVEPAREGAALVAGARAREE